MGDEEGQVAGVRPEIPKPFEVYQHFKGHRYLVVGIGKCSETLQTLVLYRQLGDPDAEIWVRPINMWHERVASEERGYCGPRFVKLIRIASA